LKTQNEESYVRCIMMKVNRVFYLLIFVLYLACSKSSTEPEDNALLERIQALPDVEAISIGPYNGYAQAYVLKITQPVDHQNPGGQTFVQRAYLMHANETDPMVFAPSGYATLPGDMQEMTLRMGANQLVVSHRYFSDSRPDPLDWQYLTIEQAAADHHRIVTLFKQIYTGVWLSSGWSKGGQTVLFHRRFYPDDVRATIAYSAPIFQGVDDPRCGQYMETLGSQADRERIKQYQRMLLENRDLILPMIRSFYQSRGYDQSMETNAVFEMAVVDYPWYFWQYPDIHHHDVNSIPEAGATAYAMYLHLADVVWLDTYADYLRDYFAPYVYQALTEIGGTSYNTDYLQGDLIDFPDINHDIHGLGGEDVTYRPEVMEDIHRWLQTEGERIITIYGGNDPLTGAAVEFTGQTDALRIVQPGAGHGVRIADLNDPGSVYRTLETWLGMGTATMNTKSRPIFYPGIQRRWPSLE